MSSQGFREMEKLFDSFKLWIQVRRDYGKRYDPDYHLFRCCEIGNLNICKLLIASQFVTPKVSWQRIGKYQLGETPIELAERFERWDVVEYLNRHFNDSEDTDEARTPKQTPLLSPLSSSSASTPSSPLSGGTPPFLPPSQIDTGDRSPIFPSTKVQYPTSPLKTGDRSPVFPSTKVQYPTSPLKTGLPMTTVQSSPSAKYQLQSSLHLPPDDNSQDLTEEDPRSPKIFSSLRTIKKRHFSKTQNRKSKEKSNKQQVAKQLYSSAGYVKEPSPQIELPSPLDTFKTSTTTKTSTSTGHGKSSSPSEQERIGLLKTIFFNTLEKFEGKVHETDNLPMCEAYVEAFRILENVLMTCLPPSLRKRAEKATKKGKRKHPQHQPSMFTRESALALLFPAPPSLSLKESKTSPNFGAGPLAPSPSLLRSESELFGSHDGYDVESSSAFFKEHLDTFLDEMDEMDDEGVLERLYQSFFEIVDQSGDYDICVLLSLLDIDQLQELIQPGTGFGVLHSLCNLGRVYLVKYLVELGLRTNHPALGGLYPLHCLLKAAKDGMINKENGMLLDQVSLDLADGLDPSAILRANGSQELDVVSPYCLEEGDTLLHYVVRMESLGALKALFPRADLLKRNLKGESAIVPALFERREELLCFMLVNVDGQVLVKLGRELLLKAKALGRQKQHEMILTRVMEIVEIAYEDMNDDPSNLVSAPIPFLMETLLKPGVNALFLRSMLSTVQYWSSVDDLFNFYMQALKENSKQSLEQIGKNLVLWEEVNPDLFFDSPPPLLSNLARMVSKSIKEYCAGGNDIDRLDFAPRWVMKWKEIRRVVQTPRPMKGLEKRQELQIVEEVKTFGQVPFFSSVEKRDRSVKLPKGEDSDWSWSPAHIKLLADHLFEACAQLQGKVSVSEFISVPLSNSGPNIALMSEFMNDVSVWVALNILVHREPSVRAKVIEGLFSLTERCFKKRNFYFAMGITVAFSQASLQRLHLTWKHVDSKTQGIFNKFRSLFSPLKNFWYVRDLVGATTSPAIFYLGIPSRDLIHIHDVNKTLIGPKDNSVNLRKFEQMYQVAETWHQRFLTERDDFELDPGIREFVKTIPNCAKEFSEETLYAMSTLLEPRKKDEFPDVIESSDTITFTETQKNKLKSIVPRGCDFPYFPLLKAPNFLDAHKKKSIEIKKLITHSKEKEGAQTAKSRHSGSFEIPQGRVRSQTTSADIIPKLQLQDSGSFFKKREEESEIKRNPKHNKAVTPRGKR